MSGIRQPCIIDIEASGFGPESYPIEIGVALDNGDKYCTLIKPAPEWTHWDNQAETVHRIPRDILETHGKPLQDVVIQLNKLLQSRTVYTDGWVVDNPWLTKLFHKSGISKEFVISAIEMIMTEEQINIWDKTKVQIIDELDLKRHRASYDAHIIQQTWIRSRQISEAA